MLAIHSLPVVIFMFVGNKILTKRLKIGKKMCDKIKTVCMFRDPIILANKSSNTFGPKTF